MHNIETSLLFCDSSAMIYVEDTIRGFVVAQTGPWSWEKYKDLLIRTVDICHDQGQMPEINLLIERLYLAEMQTDDLVWISSHFYGALTNTPVSRIAYVCSVFDTIRKRDITLPPIPGMGIIQHRIFFSKHKAIDWLVQ